MGVKEGPAGQTAGPSETVPFCAAVEMVDRHWQEMLGLICSVRSEARRCLAITVQWC
jgi:hypothetical protein